MRGMDLNKTYEGKKRYYSKTPNAENGIWGQLYDNEPEYWRLRKSNEIRETTGMLKILCKKNREFNGLGV